jgi:hypothetical protein
MLISQGTIQPPADRLPRAGLRSQPQRIANERRMEAPSSLTGQTNQSALNFLTTVVCRGRGFCLGAEKNSKQEKSSMQSVATTPTSQAHAVLAHLRS